MSDLRAGAAGGAVFVLLGVASAPLLPQPPAGNASAGSVLRYFGQHESRIVAASALAAVAALALLAFFAALRDRLAGDPLAARVAMAGGSVVVGIGVLGAVLQAGLAHVASRLGSSSAVVGAYALERSVFYVAPAFAVSVVVLAVARGGRRGTLPGWLVALSAVLAVLALVGGVVGVASVANAATVVGFVGFLLTLVWVAATSVTLWRAPARR